MGLHAFAMSRFAGVWSGMKTIQEIVESTSSVFVDPDRVDIVIPTDFTMPAGGDRKSTRLNSSHIQKSRMPSSA